MAPRLTSHGVTQYCVPGARAGGTVTTNFEEPPT